MSACCFSFLPRARSHQQWSVLEGSHADSNVISQNYIALSSIGRSMVQCGGIRCTTLHCEKILHSVTFSSRHNLSTVV